ncbi:hypothetical protein ACLADH_003126 [Escherichia coli]|uniref:Uncharacterized protein n=1 Tax=Escherichia coli TaxID=562 RepID=A0A1C7CK59_ECOLX|nr:MULTISPECIES: hypothetical protein [Escherichia]EEZ5631830.1 hypothetical protein [Escherichia coli O25]EAC1462167.1 hypothetical protein [Escherichia coli]EED0963220.1 hypothetical protein [Escherichia coli]EED1851512.1 hypothetical protein [Escherichia coli]EES0580397.1 hypothetical protein [Escherichia coli]
MSIQGKEFIDASRACLDTGIESGFRSAISRAYYAFYHETCGLLTCCPPTTHDGVVQYLISDARRKDEPYELMSLIQLGAVLKQQKMKRKRADYDLTETILQTEASSSIAVVNKMLDKIAEMKSQVA